MWLRDYGEALEADLRRFYRADLLDFYRGDMSARRLAVYVKGLPPDSCTFTLAHGQQSAPQYEGGAPDNVRYLEDIPVVPLRDAQRFVDASGEEFSSMAKAN